MQPPVVVPDPGLVAGVARVGDDGMEVDEGPALGDGGTYMPPHPGPGAAYTAPGPGATAAPAVNRPKNRVEAMYVTDSVIDMYGRYDPNVTGARKKARVSVHDTRKFIESELNRRIKELCVSYDCEEESCVTVKVRDIMVCRGSTLKEMAKYYQEKGEPADVVIFVTTFNGLASYKGFIDDVTWRYADTYWPLIKEAIDGKTRLCTIAGGGSAAAFPHEKWPVSYGYNVQMVLYAMRDSTMYHIRDLTERFSQISTCPDGSHWTKEDVNHEKVVEMFSDLFMEATDDGGNKKTVRSRILAQMQFPNEVHLHTDHTWVVPDYLKPMTCPPKKRRNVWSEVRVPYEPEGRKKWGRDFPKRLAVDQGPMGWEEYTTFLPNVKKGWAERDAWLPALWGAPRNKQPVVPPEFLTRAKKDDQPPKGGPAPITGGGKPAEVRPPPAKGKGRVGDKGAGAYTPRNPPDGRRPPDAGDDRAPPGWAGLNDVLEDKDATELWGRTSGKGRIGDVSTKGDQRKRPDEPAQRGRQADRISSDRSTDRSRSLRGPEMKPQVSANRYPSSVRNRSVEGLAYQRFGDALYGRRFECVLETVIKVLRSGGTIESARMIGYMDQNGWVTVDHLMTSPDIIKVNATLMEVRAAMEITVDKVRLMYECAAFSPSRYERVRATYGFSPDVLRARPFLQRWNPKVHTCDVYTLGHVCAFATGAAPEELQRKGFLADSLCMPTTTYGATHFVLYPGCPFPDGTMTDMTTEAYLHVALLDVMAMIRSRDTSIWHTKDGKVMALCKGGGLKGEYISKLATKQEWIGGAATRCEKLTQRISYTMEIMSNKDQGSLLPEVKAPPELLRPSADDHNARDADTPVMAPSSLRAPPSHPYGQSAIQSRPIPRDVLTHAAGRPGDEGRRTPRQDGGSRSRRGSGDQHADRRRRDPPPGRAALTAAKASPREPTARLTPKAKVQAKPSISSAAKLLPGGQTAVEGRAQVKRRRIEDSGRVAVGPSFDVMHFHNEMIVPKLSREQNRPTQRTSHSAPPDSRIKLCQEFMFTGSTSNDTAVASGVDARDGPQFVSAEVLRTYSAAEDEQAKLYTPLEDVENFRSRFPCTLADKKLASEEFRAGLTPGEDDMLGREGRYFESVNADWWNSVKKMLNAKGEYADNQQARMMEAIRDMCWFRDKFWHAKTEMSKEEADCLWKLLYSRTYFRPSDSPEFCEGNPDSGARSTLGMCPFATAFWIDMLASRFIYEKVLELLATNIQVETMQWSMAIIQYVFERMRLVPESSDDGAFDHALKENPGMSEMLTHLCEYGSCAPLSYYLYSCPQIELNPIFMWHERHGNHLGILVPMADVSALKTNLAKLGDLRGYKKAGVGRSGWRWQAQHAVRKKRQVVVPHPRCCEGCFRATALGQHLPTSLGKMMGTALPSWAAAALDLAMWLTDCALNGEKIIVTYWFMFARQASDEYDSWGACGMTPVNHMRATYFLTEVGGPLGEEQRTCVFHKTLLQGQYEVPARLGPRAQTEAPNKEQDYLPGPFVLSLEATTSPYETDNHRYQMPEHVDSLCRALGAPIKDRDIGKIDSWPGKGVFGAKCIDHNVCLINAAHRDEFGKAYVDKVHYRPQDVRTNTCQFVDIRGLPLMGRTSGVEDVAEEHQISVSRLEYDTAEHLAWSARQLYDEVTSIARSESQTLAQLQRYWFGTTMKSRPFSEDEEESRHGVKSELTLWPAKMGEGDASPGAFLEAMQDLYPNVPLVFLCGRLVPDPASLRVRPREVRQEFSDMLDRRAMREEKFKSITGLEQHMAEYMRKVEEQNAQKVCHCDWCGVRKLNELGNLIESADHESWCPWAPYDRRCFVCSLKCRHGRDCLDAGNEQFLFALRTGHVDHVVRHFWDEWHEARASFEPVWGRLTPYLGPSQVAFTRYGHLPPNLRQLHRSLIAHQLEPGLEPDVEVADAAPVGVKDFVYRESTKTKDLLRKLAEQPINKPGDAGGGDGPSGGGPDPRGDKDGTDKDGDDRMSDGDGGDDGGPEGSDGGDPDTPEGATLNLVEAVEPKVLTQGVDYGDTYVASATIDRTYLRPITRNQAPPSSFRGGPECTGAGGEDHGLDWLQDLELGQRVSKAPRIGFLQQSTPGYGAPDKGRYEIFHNEAGERCGRYCPRWWNFDCKVSLEDANRIQEMETSTFRRQLRDGTSLKMFTTKISGQLPDADLQKAETEVYEAFRLADEEDRVYYHGEREDVGVLLRELHAQVKHAAESIERGDVYDEWTSILKDGTHQQLEEVINKSLRLDGRYEYACHNLMDCIRTVEVEAGKAPRSVWDAVPGGDWAMTAQSFNDACHKLFSYAPDIELNPPETTHPAANLMPKDFLDYFINIKLEQLQAARLKEMSSSKAADPRLTAKEPVAEGSDAVDGSYVYGVVGTLYEACKEQVVVVNYLRAIVYATNTVYERRGEMLGHMMRWMSHFVTTVDSVFVTIHMNMKDYVEQFFHAMAHVAAVKSRLIRRLHGAFNRLRTVVCNRQVYASAFEQIITGGRKWDHAFPNICPVEVVPRNLDEFWYNDFLCTSQQLLAHYEFINLLQLYYGAASPTSKDIHMCEFCANGCTFSHPFTQVVLLHQKHCAFSKGKLPISHVKTNFVEIDRRTGLPTFLIELNEELKTAGHPCWVIEEDGSPSFGFPPKVAGDVTVDVGAGKETDEKDWTFEFFFNDKHKNVYDPKEMKRIVRNEASRTSDDGTPPGTPPVRPSTPEGTPPRDDDSLYGDDEGPDLETGGVDLTVGVPVPM